MNMNAASGWGDRWNGLLAIRGIRENDLRGLRWRTHVARSRDRVPSAVQPEREREYGVEGHEDSLRIDPDAELPVDDVPVGPLQHSGTTAHAVTAYS
jgi:hypothetical protein